MELTIYAKKRTSNDGKPFFGYLSTLTRKDGTSQRVSVKFREDCGSPKADKCPMNIIVDKKNANISIKEYIREDNGDICKSYTLWVSAWEPGSPFVDHSLDEFE